MLKPIKVQYSIYNEHLFKISVETEDSALSEAITAHIVEMYQYKTRTNIFRVDIVFNSDELPPFAGGALSGNVNNYRAGTPSIHLPKNCGTILVDDDDYGYEPDDETNADDYGREFAPKYVLKLDLESAIVFLHELNHFTHIFRDEGRYKNPLNAGVLGPKTVYNYRNGTFDDSYTKGDEIETYWRCLVDAEKFGFANNVQRLIKSINNANMKHYENSMGITKAELVPMNERGKLAGRGKFANMFDINRLHPTEDYQFNDEEKQQFATEDEINEFRRNYPND